MLNVWWCVEAGWGGQGVVARVPDNVLQPVAHEVKLP